MDTVKECEVDQAGTYYPSSKNHNVRGPDSSYTVKVSVGEPARPYIPSKNIVQASGSSYCPSNNQIGTLGVQVDTAPNSGFCYVTTYHNFAKENTEFKDFMWVYNSNKQVAPGQLGTVINRIYKLGPHNQIPLLDCALMRLSTQFQSSIAPGLYQGEGIPSVTVRGTNFATPGMIVKKYGMTTGLTYGRVINLPLNIDRSYANYLFAVELCDNNGYPKPGNFSEQGDSGAPVVDTFGYMLGLIVQGIGSSGSTLSLVNRIDQIQAALDVTIHTG